MTPQEAVAILCAAFPREKVTVDVVKVYNEQLRDIPPSVLDRAIERVVRTERWWPQISTIREAAAEIMLALPTEHEALTQVYNRIEWVRSGDPQAPYVHPLVLRAIHAVGGWHSFRQSDDRNEFVKLYTAMRREEIRGSMLGPHPMLSAPSRAIVSADTDDGSGLQTDIRSA